MNTTTSILKGLLSIPMTQTEIGRLTGIPQARISRWANGQIPVGADDALKLQTLLQTQAATNAVAQRV